jgi:hypothetical protein
MDSASLPIFQRSPCLTFYFGLFRLQHGFLTSNTGLANDLPLSRGMSMLRALALVSIKTGVSRISARIVRLEPSDGGSKSLSSRDGSR